MTKIINYFTGEIIAEDKELGLKQLVEKVVKEGGNLTSANLAGADLRGADLTGAYLRRVHLAGANLAGAYLAGADLRGAYLRGTDLKDAILDKAIESLKSNRTDEFKLKVVDKALEDGALNMGNWHTCDTTHCLAGWASVLSNSQELETKYPVHLIGWACLGDEWASRFYDEDDEVNEFLEQQKELLNKG